MFYSNSFVVLKSVDKQNALAQFHARESILSEQLDYAGAIGVVHITLGVTWSRFLFRSNLAPRLALLSPLLCLSHLAYLFGPAKFDFGLNMQLCVFIGLSTVAANVLVYLTDRSNERINRNLFAIAVLSVASSAALALEVFDFAPIYGLKFGRLGLLKLGFRMQSMAKQAVHRSRFYDSGIEF